ncbi:sugar transferase [Pontibacter fetidus]|uniref:Sugar transferase n=1 Tax=Pontibacter fetidus TaxID=2700082 RepID=A0A6B2H280_9BACT|nr:sugar transferase [Pontibacter fetidus]NDK56218.1 sugar transferase [Pontibacter fetidus]
MYKKYIKQTLDFVLALVALVLLLPVFVTLTLLLLVTYRTNPFFVQARPGKDGKTFRLVKFRTMQNQRAEASESSLTDAQRVTTIGKFIRNTSLDELPQLLNVLKGEMSLIGPRPLLPEYLPLYNQIQRRRHEVKPGITGWAQVNGRNAISWQEKFTYDVWYVNNMSFLLDLKILLLTIRKVLTANEITINGPEPLQKFKGNPEISHE